MAATPSDQPLRLQPIGCDQCGGTSLQPVGGGKFQCQYCGAFMLEREPPPLEIPAAHVDPWKPPPSPVHRVSAVEVLHLDAEGQVPAPPREVIAEALDRSGPKEFYRPKPLSRFVEVVDAAGHAPLRIQYQVFLERRAYQEVTHPYRGEQPQAAPLPPLWQEPLRPERTVATRRVPVRAQERVATCPGCAGAGWVRCTSCGGDGSTRCVFCGGTGHTHQTENIGGKFVERSSSCGMCGGRGKNTCGFCQGRGRNTCSTCEGQTRVLYTHERVEDFSTPTATHAISHGRDWSSHPWMQTAEGELLYDRLVQGLMDFTDADGPVAKLADQVMLAHNGTLQDGFAYWSRLTVTRVPVVEVSYRVRSTPGVLHVHGRDRRVSMPGKKPVGCAGCLLWVVGTVATLGLGAIALIP